MHNTQCKKYDVNTTIIGHGNDISWSYSNASFRLAYRSPLYRYAVWSLLAVSELQVTALSIHATLVFTASSIALSRIEVKCLQSAAVGKAARYQLIAAYAAYRRNFNNITAEIANYRYFLFNFFSFFFFSSFFPKGKTNF